MRKKRGANRHNTRFNPNFLSVIPENTPLTEPGRHKKGAMKNPSKDNGDDIFKKNSQENYWNSLAWIENETLVSQSDDHLIANINNLFLQLSRHKIEKLTGTEPEHAKKNDTSHSLHY